ncbi:FG-GAP repeat protein, partial [bacterium]|nr:FG-GAP repeat protein [bacterium]
YLGGDILDSGADIILSGDTGGFGSAVSGIGDVNGDGFDDVAAGASTWNGFTGRAHIYLGGPAMDGIADIVIDGENTAHLFGCALSGTGDINRDGFDDLMIGAYGALSYTGRVYLFWGGNPMNNVPDLVFTGEHPNDLLGRSVSSAGDVNGDRIPDMLAGAYYYGDNHNGKTYLFTSYVCTGIKAWLQGPFTGSGMTSYLSTGDYMPLKSPFADSLEVSAIPGNVTDWVLVQLRTQPDGNTCSQRSFFLMNNGMVADTSGVDTILKMPGVPDGNYHIVVHHRNHVPVMSLEAQPMGTCE